MPPQHRTNQIQDIQTFHIAKDKTHPHPISDGANGRLAHSRMSPELKIWLASQRPPLRRGEPYAKPETTHRNPPCQRRSRSTWQTPGFWKTLVRCTATCHPMVERGLSRQCSRHTARWHPRCPRFHRKPIRRVSLSKSPAHRNF